MKIIGGHDYYDCVMSMGIDTRTILLRGKNKSIPVENAGGSLLKRKVGLVPAHSPRVPSVRIKGIAVVFCDKVYRGVLGNFGPPDKWSGIWSPEKLWDFVAQEKGRKVGIERRWNEPKMTLEEYFQPYPTGGFLRDYMIEHKLSILVEEETVYFGEDASFAVNPFTLRRIGFAHALNPYTAFQELSMWISGVLGGTSPEIVTIKDDRTLIEGHGFDNRFSFRGPRIP